MQVIPDTDCHQPQELKPGFGEIGEASLER